MAALGLPVPPAFVVPIGLCAGIVAEAPEAMQQLAECLAEGIGFLESATGQRFGDRRRPLLVSVRSGAARSMPGMLDTVLDVGCTEDAVHGLIRQTGNPRFAWDCRRRFLESFTMVVRGLDAALFARQRAEMAAAEGVSEATLDGEALERLALAYETLVDEHAILPASPMAQLEEAARAVYRSWTSDRATIYRRLQKLEDLQGTAVTVQAMVFGNRGRASGAGVAFSRDPSNGAAEPVIELLFEAQGEDIVSGRITPEGKAALTSRLPDAAAQLCDILGTLEAAFTDVQDVEFTIENGRLWILQTRAAKRTPRAALRFALDFVRENRIDAAEALRRLAEIDLASLSTARFRDAGTPVARGIGASAGLAAGRAAFDPARAVALAEAGEAVLLLRPDTSTADVAGFSAAAGIVTAAGGCTAHAALVARQMAKPCIVGCAALEVDAARAVATLAGKRLAEGDWLSIDGETGEMFLGRRDMIIERPEAELAALSALRARRPPRPDRTERRP
ncbi:MAG TPA: PEP/pyruvate-binding domain-containing protein [Acidocella sp.]|jgi:pyruvate,orthophosphate dikinase|uniref:PEP/pyruvate-binding domain-containing protein n=1 Tax=Acidocella sp. TaxID=50710 RepID=UPI002D0429CF|nr:PEP/pyruvate-binding domain-containing protein [Acidocella sp.]HVE22870.1 PEP/pyruvate-binding domain-containing protein [Acidocella sp.]